MSFDKPKIKQDEYKVVAVAQSNKNEVVVRTRESSCLITGLASGEYYVVRVCSISRETESPFAEAKSPFQTGK